MKTILFILCFSVCAFGQNDVCKETSDVEKIPIVPGVSLETIATKINTNKSKSLIDTKKLKTLIVEVQAGTYEGEIGILIERDNVCLIGVNKPILTRTKFNNEKHEPSVIKISGVSNVTVKGFEIRGTTINADNRDVGPTGITVVNFSNEAISNIHIENNIIHSIGQFYDYGNKNGFWRYAPEKDKEDDKSDCNKTKTLGLARTKFSCGQAHGINVASNQNPISLIFIKGNTLRDLQLGESEAITIGERISEFDVSGNTIYDVDNIAIDIAGMQDSKFQSSSGTVDSNIIYRLKGTAQLGGQNSSYPFVAGIYIDGGTGLSWEKSIKVTGNTVTDFGIGISVGSENRFCNDNAQKCNDDYCRQNPTKCKNGNKCIFKERCNYVQTQFVEIRNNILKRNQVYGIGIGKDGRKQNSQTWNIRVFANTLIDNVLSPDERGYSQLHFGSLEPDSLKEIEARNNVIKAFGNNARLLVRVVGFDSDSDSEDLLFLTPDVKFYENVFYSDVPEIWSWGISKKESRIYNRGQLVPDGKTLNLPPGIVGDKNVWGTNTK